MATETDVANMALSHLGVGIEIQDLESESSQQAQVCRRFFGIARDKALADCPWPFAKAFATLGLVAEDPIEEWSFSYRIPADSLVIRRLRSGQRRDSESTSVPFATGQDGSGALLFTDQTPCDIEYTKRIEDSQRWDVDFSTALSYLLASYIAPRIAAGDNTGLTRRCYELYVAETNRAMATILNGERHDLLPPSSFARARE